MSTVTGNDMLSFNTCSVKNLFVKTFPEMHNKQCDRISFEKEVQNSLF